MSPQANGAYERKQREEQLDPISRAKPFSKQFCPKRSTGNRSQHSRLRCALRLLSVNLFRDGPYTIRVKVPRGVKLMPHRHPEDRIYTVISGIFYIGLGDQFDAEKLLAYPPGAVIILPGNTSHFHWAKSGDYITQVTAIGPLGLEYINAKDDPRNEGSSM